MNLTRTYSPSPLLFHRLGWDEQNCPHNVPSSCQYHSSINSNISFTTSYLSSSYSARYTFSGKERDEETGYSYFGARYYNSTYSIWMSIDPMSDKYPSLSPYAYCGNNPVKLVDPNGEEISEHIDKYGNLIAHYDDGDNSVYKHDKGTTKKDIDLQRITLQNTGGSGVKIGELGGNIDVSKIMKNKLEQSAQEASSMGIYDYYLAVKTGEKWDLKNNKNTIFGVAWSQKKQYNTTFSFGDYNEMSAADIGNYHAGYAGRAAHIPHYLLWKGAGAAETIKDFKNGSYLRAVGRAYLLTRYWSLSSGDRIRDFKWNSIGMFDFDKK